MQRGTDPWGYGRWAYAKYRGKDSHSLLVIGGYRVGHRTGTAGASTAWYQQKVLLAKDQRDIEPEIAFLQDLEEWIGTQRDSRTEVILFLDANEQWSESARIKQFSMNLGLKNLNTDGGYNFPATHPSISNPERDTTIDFCLCSATVLEHITYATMTPYDLNSLGDHRGFLIDLDIRRLLRLQRTDSHVNTGRKLATNNQKVTKKYLTQVVERFDSQNIITRAKKLYHQWRKEKKSRWDIMKTYEKLDLEIFNICRKAERDCRATMSGRHHWSPALDKAIKVLAYWRARTKYQDNNLLLMKLGNETGIIYEYYTIEELALHVESARTALQQVRKKSIEYRQKHLVDVAEEYAKANNVSKMTAIKELISHESTRQMYSILREKLKTDKSGQLTKLWIALDKDGEYTKDAGNKQVLTKESEIHKQLLRRNRRHLGQAKHTPFAGGRWAATLKWDGSGDLGSDILSGNILNKERFERTAQLYFESLRTTRLSRSLNIVKPELTLGEYKKFWKRKREETGTSPYGLHVGHFKAALQNDDIMNVHRIMLLIPFQTAIVPHRWKKTVQTMLEKDPGHPWIHRLRIIELFDSQVNAGFQIFIGRKMIWEAVKAGQLHAASFGSTPGKMASSALLQKVLSVDQLKVERRAGGIFDCDAKGCYDRIIPPLATVHLQAIGLDTSIATFLARFMFVAKRYVKTKHGVSHEYIRTSKENPLYGIGQGNGGGPAIWLAHLTVMFTALSSICNGFVAHCIKGLEILITVGTGYVDDVTLFVSLDRQSTQTEAQVKKKLQIMATTWERLLYLTGGKLELSKCFWIPVIWKWKKGDPVIDKCTDSGIELRIRDSENGQKITIPRIQPTDAEKRLGIHYSVDGSWAYEYKRWLSFSKDYAWKIRTARLDRLGGLQAYKTLWCSKFRYGAPIFGFNKRQAINIQKRIIGNSLAVAGYNSKMPRAVVFGPATFGGMSWESPYSILCHEQIKMVIGSIRINDTVGKLIRIQLTWLQITAGHSTPLLESKRAIPYLPRCWLQALHEKLAEEDIQLHIANIWTPTPTRTEDQVIMDYVMHNIPEKMWRSINQCRLFLQATTFSDITSFDGSVLSSTIVQVKEPYRQSRLNYPLQKRPSKEARGHWKYFIKFISDSRHKLHTKLGDWIRSPDQKFPYVMGTTNNILYKGSGTTWKVYHRYQNTRNTYHPTELHQIDLPRDWTPTNIIKKAEGRIVVIRPETTVEGSIAQEKQLGDIDDETKRKLLGTFVINHEEAESIKLHWQTGQVHLVCGSDGGLKDRIGTSGYVIYGEYRENPLVKGYSAEQQYDDKSSSTRQELLAQICVEYWIQQLATTWGQPCSQLRTTLVTDSQSSMDILKKMDQCLGMKDRLSPDMDVALELHTCRRRNTHSALELIKVKSHTAEAQDIDEIYWRLNREADDLATAARDAVRTGDLQARPPQFLEGAKAMVSVQGILCVTQLKSRIQSAIYSGDLQEFLCRKYHWTNNTFSNINWRSHQWALERVYGTQQVTAYKYVHGWLSTKQRRFREGAYATPYCVLCHEEEDNIHFFRCQSESMQFNRKMEFKKLSTNIRKITTASASIAMEVGIQSLGDRTTDTYRREFVTERGVYEAMGAQEVIGWDHFALGRISQTWQTVGPNETYTKDKSDWANELTNLVLRYGLALWTQRNNVVHGNDGDISKMELRRAHALIAAIYEEIFPEVQREHAWLFSSSFQTKLDENYSVQIAWIDSVRQLYPEQFFVLSNRVGRHLFEPAELERTKTHRTGEPWS